MTPFWVFITVLLVVNLFYYVEGHECYLCVYVSEGLGAADIGLTAEEYDEFYDESCKSGRVPKAKFIETCNDGLACKKLTTEGYSQFDNSPIKVVTRGCSITAVTKSECRLHSFMDLTKDPGVPTALISKLSSNARIEECTCTTDTCNKASGSPTSSVFLCIFSVIFTMMQFMNS